MSIINTQNRVCYGYSRNADGELEKNTYASIVEQIFLLYLSGDSLRSIIKWLEDHQAASPSGKESWTPRAIAKLLSNTTYLNGIISSEQFAKVQQEKVRRSNQIKTDEGIVRKPTRYHSQNVLSGLFICGECGHSYRRITKHDGSIIWRCASRVEYGQEFCKHSVTLKETEMQHYLWEFFGPIYTNQDFRNRFEKIIVKSDGTLVPFFKQDVSGEKCI